jgi:hypothetical protein
VPQPEATPNLGEQIDQWDDLRRRVKEAETELVSLKSEAKDLFDAIASNLDALGIELARGRASGVSVFFTENDTAALDDPQAFGDYVVSSNQPYLYQARVSPKACLELINQGEVIPGVRALKVRKLSYKSGK